jgi:hypothetical protein
LEGVGGRREDGLAASGGLTVGRVSAAHVQVRPRRPRAPVAARAHLGLEPARVAPVQADQVEATRRPQRAGGPPAGGRRGRRLELVIERELEERSRGGNGWKRAHEARGERGGTCLQGLATGESATEHEASNTYSGRPKRFETLASVLAGAAQRAAHAGHSPRKTMSCPPMS